MLLSFGEYLCLGISVMPTEIYEIKALAFDCCLLIA